MVEKKVRNLWMAKAEKPEAVSFMWGGRAVLLEGSERMSLGGKRVLYIRSGMADGEYGIAKRWKVVESREPDGWPRSVPFKEAPWLADSIKAALADAQVTAEKALVLYDPLFFGKPLRCSSGQVPHHFLIAGLHEQQVEEADALLFMLNRGYSITGMDAVQDEARSPSILRSLKTQSASRWPSGLVTKCHDTVFNPEMQLTTAVLENTGKWPVSFIPVEGLVYATKGWQSIEQPVVEACVDRLAAHRVAETDK